MPRSLMGQMRFARRLLQEGFVVLTAGTLLVAIPLQTKRNQKRPAPQISRITDNTGEVEMISTSRPESFVSWLSDQMEGLGQGDTY